MFKRPLDLAERFSGRIPMGPRKKSKPNPESDNQEQHDPLSKSRNADAPTPVPDSGSESGHGPGNIMSVDVPVAPSLRAVSTSQASQSSPQLIGNGSLVQKNMENRSSWYGSWKGKAKPVAEVAKDNVPASPIGATSRTVSHSTSRPSQEGRQLNGHAAPSPRRYMSGSMRQKSKADVLPASTSNLSVQSGNVKDMTEVKAKPSDHQKEAIPDPPLPPNPVTLEEPDTTSQLSKGQQRPVSGWFGGWWSRPDGYEEKQATLDKKEAEVKVTEDAQQRPLPESPVEERTQRQLSQAASMAPSQETMPTKSGQQEQSFSISGLQRSSWFWSWSTQQNTQPDGAIATSGGKVNSKDAGGQRPPADLPTETPKSNADTPAVPSATSDRSDSDGTKELSRKSSAWAFWSREVTDPKGTGTVHKQIGEIAVADTPSQSSPEAAQFNETPPQPEEPPKLKTKAASLRGRARPTATQSEPTTPAKATPAGSPERDPSEPKVAAVAGRSTDEQPKQSKAESKDDKNILLPDFTNTYSILQEPSIWQRIQRMFISDAQNFPGPHLHLTSNPPRIKKALAIGIHGFFPSPLYQKILGQPTGTSIRFANCAAQAIKTWAETRGYDCEIEKVALEGEGLINDRVDTLWKLLLNWIDHIREADFILVAAHSQGVPVAAMLVAKLIQLGCIGNARVGICAMAGISLGPFAEYKTRIFGGSALELFDFTDPKSKVSEAYRAAVEEVLKAGVRIVYVGSIDDQLVSLDSSTFSPASHPNIYRAVFIDGRLHTSDFLSQLIGFAFKLRNLGLPDHGLIRELSPALAGSLYTGEGHSSLHRYMPIYDLAVRHTLETVAADNATAEDVRWGELKAPAAVKDQNPYFLPWALRGVLEEEAVRREMGNEVEELLRTFEEWRPTSKGLKDVRFRLEAVRSKL